MNFVSKPLEVAPPSDILVVDDEPNNLRVLSTILESSGYGVRQAIDGKTALKAIQVEPPDLILLDILMPELGGYDVCQQLKHNSDTAEIPVIFLSALNRTQDKVKGFEVGGADYITKPFQVEEVLARINHQLEIRSLQQQLQQKNQKLETALSELQQTQLQLVQAERMSSLGQLAAGVAYEINNPINFIYANINYVAEYSQKLLEIIQLYVQYYPQPYPEIKRIIEEYDLDFLIEDFPKAIASMETGANRVEDIISSMSYFARIDSAQMQQADLHKGIESTLSVLQNRLQAQKNLPPVLLRRNYGELPLVNCYAGQLNQVFLTLLVNAIDSLEEKIEAKIDFAPAIAIATRAIGNGSQWVEVWIEDNGSGRLGSLESGTVERFFATQPTDKRSAIGLSISYSIVVDRHRGQLQCRSQPGEGTQFYLRLPVDPMAIASS
ncbi:MAG: hybrid sensor histidine kinase/response regulator [Cyanobacteriota bacterium]|nr:hybrid sensor histidine kinase/response regulator [Cyanobacteriota bacterium]